MIEDMKKMACFGVAGNFTGHLEQAGEAKDFANFAVVTPDAPKALFPTYIPEKNPSIPDFLNTFPFSSEKIVFPNETDFFKNQKVQLESECGIIFKAEWQEDTLVSLSPLCFAASNDVSIRREGAKKISEKKNWGPCSKGFAKDTIELSSFSAGGILDHYNIASFIVRDGKAYAYGEDSPVKTYSYMYEKLTDWLIDKFNNQKDTGPAENIHEYLVKSGKPPLLFVSIGATRYTEFGQTNFLCSGDAAVVIVYPSDKYSQSDVEQYVQSRACGAKTELLATSVLWQDVSC